MVGPAAWEIVGMDLGELCDRQEITDLLTRYTRAVDTKSFDELADVFVADALLDYSRTGGPVGTMAEVRDWLAQGLGRFDRHQHLLGQVEIVLDGDEASALAYFYNPMVSTRQDGSEVLIEVGGYYRHTLSRTPTGWRSTGMVDDIVWARGL